MTYSRAISTLLRDAARFQEQDHNSYAATRMIRAEGNQTLASLLQEAAAIDSADTRSILFAIIEHIADSAR